MFCGSLQLILYEAYESRGPLRHLMWPYSILELYTVCGPSASVLVYFDFHVHVK
jgi:hypothetical protein